MLSKNQLMSLLGNEKISRQVDDHQIDEPQYHSWLDLGAGDGGALERLGARHGVLKCNFENQEFYILRQEYPISYRGPSRLQFDCNSSFIHLKASSATL